MYGHNVVYGCLFVVIVVSLYLYGFELSLYSLIYFFKHKYIYLLQLWKHL